MKSPCCNKEILRLNRAKLVCSKCKKDITLDIFLITQLDEDN
jgi:hypothetical protein